VSSTDFTLQDATRPPTKWEFNNNVGLSFNRLGTSPVVDLGLADNKGGQYGIAWTNDTFKLDSFSMYADIIVDFHPRGPGVDANCPADGFALAFGAPTDQFQVGGGGGSLGLYSNGDGIPQFIAFEVNTWYGQSIDDTSGCATHKNVTFAFADANADSGVDRGSGDKDTGGGKIGQTTAPDALQTAGATPIVNGGWFRYQWNVDVAAKTMSAYITGLDDSNKAVQNVKLADITWGAAAPKFDFTGRLSVGWHRWWDRWRACRAGRGRVTGSGAWASADRGPVVKMPVAGAGNRLCFFFTFLLGR